METVRSQEWRYREEDIGLAGIISERLDIHPILARIMVARSILDPELAYEMLHPSLRNLHDPFLFKNMERSVERIKRAIDGKEGITIHGDYDVDGISSTALLRNAMERAVGKERLNHFLPSRFEEGYGLSPVCIDAMAERGDSLLITVDCAITAFDEVKMANERGIDVIITDHHEPGDKLPPAFSIIDPKTEDSGYPFRELAGVGVAFKLATALQTSGIIEKDVRELLDLVALGTVSDLVPLIDENRSLVHFGLEKLAKTDHIGLGSLMAESGIEPWKGLHSTDISFKLGPRLNSAGRLTHPGLALDLILTHDRVDAELFSRELCTLNFKRRSIGKKLVDDISEEIKRTDQSGGSVIVVGAEGWNPGVIGVSASKLVEMTGKPSFILSIDGNEARGSARAPRGFNLVEALNSVSDILIKHGGHESAAGLTIDPELIGDLRKRLSKFVDENYPDQTFTPVIDVDLDLMLHELDLKAVYSFDRLGPYGNGNPQPLVSIRDVSIGYDVKTVGSGKHLKFSVTDGDGSIDCIWFNMGEHYEQLSPGTSVTVVGLVEVHKWGGKEDVQMKVNDMFVLG